MQRQWPPEMTLSGEAAEVDVAVAGLRHYMLRSWQHSELRRMALHIVEPEEVDYIAALPGHVIFEGPWPAC